MAYRRRTLLERKKWSQRTLHRCNLAEFEEYLFSHQFREELKQKKQICVPFSGGYESTAIVAFMYNNNYSNVKLIWNNTLRSMKECRAIIKRGMKITGYELAITKPSLKYKGMNFKNYKQLLEYLYEIDKEVLKKLDSGELKYNKKLFKCCEVLKDKPFREFVKVNTNMIFVSGLASYEGRQRRYRLMELMKQDTYTRVKSSMNNAMFIYPFRDLTNSIDQKIVGKYIEMIFNVKPVHSGCRRCPIVYHFDIKDFNGGIEANRLFYDKLLNTPNKLGLNSYFIG